MANVSAAMVKELRDQTGAGMMDCKAALNETGGNLDPPDRPIDPGPERRHRVGGHPPEDVVGVRVGGPVPVGRRDLFEVRAGSEPGPVLPTIAGDKESGSIS